ncbi:MAG: bifunctional adenosylcobinamide kinase/adenosylcobinamide-phosphate guanylyltransferase, partial [Actinomycetes bacterium]
MALSLGGKSVLYVATADTSEDPDLAERVRAHRDRRPAGWDTLEVGSGVLDPVMHAAEGWDAVLLDSLTLWVSAGMNGPDERVLAELDGFLRRAGPSPTPFIVVSDEVGLGVVPESAAGRRFRDLLGLANQRVAAVAGEVYLCVAGVGMRVK